MPYPENCLRGLSKKDHVIDGHAVDTTAFMPYKATAANRDDGGEETSINWEDDDSVFDKTMGDRQLSAHGVARLPRASLDHAINQPGANGALWYERREVPGNVHHGNIVFRSALPTRHKRMIAAALALASSYHARP